MNEATDNNALTKILSYSIDSFSSFSSVFYPENILKNNPSDHSSRWSSDSTIPPQFLLLKLERPAIVNSIYFGKYEKTHVCNLKKFRVYGGLTSDNFVLLLESGLKNDNVPETFSLDYKVEGVNFPCRFIKIVPIQSWGPSFNFSIWYLELSGIDDWDIVKSSVMFFNEYREREAVRLCLKHLRQNQYLEVFESLQKRTKVQLEDPLLSELHEKMVVKGDYVAAEEILNKAAENGLFGSYICQQDYVPHWSRIHPNPEDFGQRPGMRGGHQMCIDIVTETIYLFGGWDGAQDLNDLWAYNIAANQWTLLSGNTEAEGGPSPRSCHKMCLDTEHQQLFILGRYLDSQNRQPSNLKSDFYMYDIEHRKWHLICEDTAAMGGPRLIFDHQMCLDPLHRNLYVFGGRIINSAGGFQDSGVVVDGAAFASGALPGGSAAGSILGEPQFSGLYVYHIPTSTWRLLREDPAGSTQWEMRSRIGHSMLLHPGQRKLYVFAGQRSKEYLSDFFAYNIDTGSIDIITDGNRKDAAQIPAAGFTQRATIDCDLNEIYVLSGLNKDKEKREENVKNSFWVYNILLNKWTCIYRNEDQREKDDVSGAKLATPEQPCPRFAHQLVYDQGRKVHYLFGGNPGRPNDPKMRLDDFWSLRLTRPSPSQLLQHCRFLLRKCQFRDLARRDTVQAMRYLQTQLSEVVDRANREQMTEFHGLTNVLFRSRDQEEEEDLVAGSLGSSSDPGYHLRSGVFDELVQFFPKHMAQPKENLVEFISF